MWRSVAILALAVACHALPAQDTSRLENKIVGLSDCLKKDSTACLKYKFFSIVDKLVGQRDTFTLSDGVTVVRASDVPPETGAPRSLDPVDKVKNYFETHSLQVEVKGADVIEVVTNVGRALEDTITSFTEEDDLVEEGRKKKKKIKKIKKIMGPLIGIMMMKKMLLLKLGLGLVALIAGKALVVAKLALVLAIGLALKKLLMMKGSGSGMQQKKVTYEVLALPAHSSSHSSSHDDGWSSNGGESGGFSSGGDSGGGWGRSMDAQMLAYSGHKH